MKLILVQITSTILLLASACATPASPPNREPNACNIDGKGEIARFISVTPEMAPAIFPREAVLIDTGYYETHGPNLGDIVAYHRPRRESVLLLGRLIGMPPHSLVIKNGVVSISHVLTVRTPLPEKECAKLKADMGDEWKDTDYLDKCFMETVGDFKHPIFDFRNPSSGKGEPVNILMGTYYILGDNRGLSIDSRNFGLVDKKLIIGKVIDPIR